MKKLLEIEISSKKEQKSISVNSMYLNSRWVWKWRTLAPWARAYKNYLHQEIKEIVKLNKFEILKDTLVFFEIDLRLWVSKRWRNKIESWKKPMDTDWLIKIPQDAMTELVYEDDDQVVTFDSGPVDFYVWKWFELFITVYEWNEKDYYRWRTARSINSIKW